MTKKIVLLHATPVAMQPIAAAMAELWPEATAVHLLDEGLSQERALSPDLTDALLDRFVRFGLYARDSGADGILATCSAFGEALDVLAEKVSIPVLKPNEAMFVRALESGNRIGMVATFQPAIGGMEQEFRDMAAKRHQSASLTSLCAAGAMEQLRAGHDDVHNQLVAEYARQLTHCDAIMLAHFSTSRALKAVQAAVSVPVLAAPQAAVEQMKILVEQQEGKSKC